MPSIIRNRNRILLAIICFVSFFLRLGSVGLFDFNEGFYAQVAREMALRGDFITPRANGLFFFDKPPLALWCSAASIKVFGTNEFAVRLPVAIAATLLVLAVYWFGAKKFSERTGLFAAAMTAMNPMMIATARQMTMDIHQCLWFAIAMIAFYVAYSATTVAGKRNYYLFWAACGMSFLAKSAPGLFPILCCLVFVFFNERWNGREIWKRIREAKPIVGIIILVAIIAPWHYLAWKANGKVFYEEYWLLHHVQLLNGKDFNHAQPVWFYVPMLIGGLFPWSIYLPLALRFRPTLVGDERSRALKFALIWAVVVFVIFTLMKSKLISYLLPMYPAAALIVANWMDQSLLAGDKIKSRTMALYTLLVAVLGFVGIAVSRWAIARAIHNAHFASDLAREFPPAVWNWTIQSFWIAIAGGSVATALLFSRRMRLGVIALFCTMGLFTTLAVIEGLPAMEATKMAPLQLLARRTGDAAAEGWPIAIHIAGPRRPSVFFHMPDALFLHSQLPVSVGENGLILERGEPEEMFKFFRSNQRGKILTDSDRAAFLMKQEPAIHVVESMDRWQILEFNKSGSAQ